VALDGEPLSGEEVAALQDGSLPAEGVPVSTSAQVGVGVVVIFTFTPPTSGPTIVIVFPGASVSPTLIVVA
jgi:hypothetical protein